MHNHYKDLYDRIPEPPLWFDEAGVPRYEPFSPILAWNIYAREAVLMEIACQACSRLFVVCMTQSRATLAEDVRKHTIHYGDPPNVNCCPAGPTMNSEPKRILEFWDRGEKDYKAALAHLPKPPTRAQFGAVYETLDDFTISGWDRVPELEIDLPPRWGS